MVKIHTYGDLLTIGNPSKISTNKWVFWISILSVVWMFAYKLVFVRILEIFPKASEIGEIMFNLLGSVVASGIFYYFVVYLEKKNIKRTIYPVLIKKLLNINIYNTFILTELSKAYKNDFSQLPDQETFNSLYKHVLLNDKPPIVIKQEYDYQSWREFFTHQLQNIHFLLEDLHKYSAFLTPKLLLKISDIESSNFELALNNTINYPETSIGNPSIGLWSFLKDLQELNGNNLKD